VSSKRLGQRASGVSLRPLISKQQMLIVLPDTFKDPGNHIGHYMLKAANMLKYKVKLQPYDRGKLRDQAEFDKNLALGFYMSLTDGECQFNFNSKIDAYESGRSIARAQMLLGFLSDLDIKGSSEVLRANDYYFGNLQSKSGQIKKDLRKLEDNKDAKPKKSTVGKKYWLHTAPALFMESEWDQHLTKVLSILMKDTHALMPANTIMSNLMPNLLTYSEVVRGYCTRSIVTVPARGRTPAVTVDKVPVKPRANNLLLKEEIAVIDRISASLWEPTPWERMNPQEWADNLLTNGLNTIKTDLVRIYSDRASFLSKLASLTTKRLQIIRAMAPEMKTKRKSDITPEILGNAILTRPNPLEAFTSEVMGLDTNGDLFVKEWASGVRFLSIMQDKSHPMIERIKTSIRSDIVNSDPYSSLIAKREDMKAHIDAFRKQASDEARETSRYWETLKQTHGPSLQKWKSNFVIKDLRERINVGRTVETALTGEMYTRQRRVPHSSTKQAPFQADAKAAKKGRLIESTDWPWDKTRAGVIDMKPLISNDIRREFNDVRKKTDSCSLSRKFVLWNAFLANRGLPVHKALKGNEGSLVACLQPDIGDSITDSLVASLPGEVTELLYG